MPETRKNASGNRASEAASAKRPRMGCVHLTDRDALALAHLVDRVIPIEFTGG
jgi:hypothetical protein